jgi:ribosomal protein S17E
VLQREAVTTVEDMLMLDDADWRSVGLPLAVCKKIIMRVAELRSMWDGQQDANTQPQPQTQPQTPVPAPAPAAVDPEAARRLERDVAARVSQAFDDGRAEALVACKAKIDAMKSTANARFTALQDELDAAHAEKRKLAAELATVTSENLRNKDLVRGYVSKAREAREQSAKENAALTARVAQLEEEKRGLMVQYEYESKDARAQAASDKRALLKASFDRTFNAVANDFDVNEVLDGEQILRKFRDLLKKVAADSLADAIDA